MTNGLTALLSGATHLILDFDGVVADSEPLFRRSWNHALSSVGHRVSEEDYWLHWSSLGEGLEGELSRSGLELSEARRERLRAMQREAYAGYCRQGLVPLARGARELLGLLEEGGCGLRGWAIASNTDSRLVEEVLRRAEAPLPPLLVGGEGLNRKPAPDIFLRASELLEAEPARCLVVEDSVKGIRAALAGGFPVVRVLNPQNRSHGAPAMLHLEGLAPLSRALTERRHDGDA